MTSASSTGNILCVICTLAVLGCSMNSERAASPQVIRSENAMGTTIASVPSGTTMVVALDEPLSTTTHKTGDWFTARTMRSVTVEGKTVFPVGSEVRGRLTHVQAPGRTSGKAEMTLSFEEIVDASGRKHSISAELIPLQAADSEISDEETVAGGAVIGGIIGALTSKKKTKGAVTGALGGAAVGGVIALATKGNQIELPAGQRIEVALTRTVEVPISRVD
jgi:hypothetical protein